MQDRVCRTCQKTFKGGPRAYYCPSCRAERERESMRRYKRNKRAGNIRPLGSKDECERCGGEYTVQGGNQRFCSTCQPIHNVEHDRTTSLAFYHENKERINPPRNERRKRGRKGIPATDIIGQRFGRLTPLEEANHIGNLRRFLCRCDCGNETIVRLAALRSGNTTSCGCLHGEVFKNRIVDLVGQRFSFLEVIERVDNDKYTSWRCRCDCGNETVVLAGNLTTGNTISCGCMRRSSMEKVSANRRDIDCQLCGRIFWGVNPICPTCRKEQRKPRSSKD